MRVLHLGKYYAPQRGGIERYLQDLAEWLVDRGHGVGALVHQPPGQWRSRHEVIHGVELCRAGCVAAPLYTPLSPAFPWLLQRALKSTRPDVLDLHLPNPSCFAALASPRARALPWLVHWQADVSADVPDWRIRTAYRLYRPFEQAVLARARFIVTTSEAYAEASTALAPWKSKLRIVPLGIGEAEPTQARGPTWPLPDSLRLLSVGRLSHYKGHAVLLEALTRVPGASLVLIGEGEESGKLRSLALRLGINERVSFAGEVDDANLRAAYAEADLFVFPSLDRSESFGLVLLEAMRQGLAVVASDIPGSGVGQVVGADIGGLLVPPRDPQALASALLRAADPELRSRLGSAGQQRWQSRFTLDRSAQAVLDLYERMTVSHRPAEGRAG